MFESLKKSWKKIQEDPPGKRFRRQYKRRHDEDKNIGKKILFLGGGVFIVLAGIFFLPAPGPGMLIIFIGLGLISQESLWLAVILDKLEVYLREIYDWGKELWQQASLFLKSMIILAIILICGLALYAAYYWLFLM